MRPLFAGPSPRAWGKRLTINGIRKSFRTIPTGVGKTYREKFRPASRADHPHGRGENTRARGFSLSFYGPSPRAWGKRDWTDSEAIDQRTIPTGVGKTIFPVATAASYADHPHGRGENYSGGQKFLTKSGPSPRAWGKRKMTPSLFCSFRTIPTGVGKTFKRIKRIKSNSDHPHGRGENENPGKLDELSYGPSPRAWGKPPRPDD